MLVAVDKSAVGFSRALQLTSKLGSLRLLAPTLRADQRSRLHTSPVPRMERREILWWSGCLSRMDVGRSGNQRAGTLEPQ